MSAMDQSTTSQLQGHVIDFALAELVRQHRNSFQPLWSVESWAKFLIWLALNCGLSGERETLEQFAEALGPRLTSRMRLLFFERTLEDEALKVMADPADLQVLVMPSTPAGQGLTLEQAAKALQEVGLQERVDPDRTRWQSLDAVVAIPWNPAADVDGSSAASL